MTTPTVRPAAGLPEDKSGPERRRAPRYPSDLKTTCRPLTAREGASWPACALNISCSGIALILGRRFEPGTVLAMELEDPFGAVSRSVVARVIHVHPHEDGTWKHGCAFAAELDDDELRAFRAERVRPDEPDCRAWVRFDCDVATTYEDPAGDGDSLPARIVNVGPGGVALVVGAPYEKGTLLWLQLPGPLDQPGRTALVRVVQPGQPSGEQWLVGCEFADRLNEDDLLGLAS
jgi:hypothetical protein